MLYTGERKRKREREIMSEVNEMEERYMKVREQTNYVIEIRKKWKGKRRKGTTTVNLSSTK